MARCAQRRCTIGILEWMARRQDRAAGLVSRHDIVRCAIMHDPHPLTRSGLFHGQVLATSKDLKTSACTAAGRPHPKLLEIFKKIPTEVMEKFYGCGAPLPLGIDGERIQRGVTSDSSRCCNGQLIGCINDQGGVALIP